MAHATLINPQETRNDSSGQLANVVSLHVRLGAKVLRLQEAALDITTECKHETKAADVAIQFVLTPGNGAILRGKSFHSTTRIWM